MVGLLLLSLVLAQQPRPEPRTDPAVKKRAEVFGHTHSIADRFLSFKDPRYRVLGLAQLAGVHCKVDPGYARLLLERGHQQLLLAEADARAQKPPRSLGTLRINFQARAAACNRDLAQRFAQDAPAQGPADQSMPWQLIAAREQINDDPDLAASLLRQAVDSSPTGFGMQALPFLIQNLRGKDDSAADSVFLSAIAELRRRPAINLDDLMYLGLALFGAPSTVGRDETAMLAGVGGRGGVPVVVLTADRPDLKPELARAYLDLVVDVVMRPASDADKPRVYAMGQMLLPKAQAYLPEKAAVLQGTLQYLNIGLSSQVTDPASYARLGQSNDQRDEEGLKYIESLSDDGQKDALYTSHVRGHIFFADRPDHAREIAGKVKDADLRRSLLVHMDFADAARLLERKRTDDALDVAGRLPAGIERCLLRLSAASAIGKADQKAAFALVTAALEDARTVDDDRQPYLFLSAAIVLLSVYMDRARQTFMQAIFKLNGEPPPEPSTSERRTYNPQAQRGPRPKPERKPRAMPRGQGYFMTLLDETEPGTQVSLRLPGVKAYDFESAMLPLFAVDPKGTDAIVRTLASERLLYQALPVLAKAWLQTLPTLRP